jgi:hypothetical protein
MLGDPNWKNGPSTQLKSYLLNFDNFAFSNLYILIRRTKPNVPGCLDRLTAPIKVMIATMTLGLALSHSTTPESI